MFRSSNSSSATPNDDAIYYSSNNDTEYVWLLFNRGTSSSDYNIICVKKSEADKITASNFIQYVHGFYKNYH